VLVLIGQRKALGMAPVAPSVSSAFRTPPRRANVAVKTKGMTLLRAEQTRLTLGKYLADIILLFRKT
jgi:hypothetical protein